MSTTYPTPSTAPPPITQIGPLAWIRKNFFSSWFNSLLTIIIVAVLFNTISRFFSWATTNARWEVISANLPLYFVGRFPADQRWRTWAILILIALLSGLTWGILSRNVAKLLSRNVLIGTGLAAVAIILVPTALQLRLLLLGIVVLVLASAWAGQQAGRNVPELGRWLSFAWFLSFFIVLWLLTGGLVLREISTNDWGGLLLTLFMAVISIILSFPIGVLLALGRQSSLTVVRWFSILYIELIRGVPLISILFMGQVMIPLFLPEGVRPDRVLRAIVGLTLFASAYLAENVRGGLQSIPRGQTEAANALGLSTPLVLALIILPQALKISIPAIVGQFISLFQDTTLLSIVGVVELLGISNSIRSNPQFLGTYAEVYLFIGIIYWVFCYAMSLGSRRLEQVLNAGQR
jgi:general L-amino acid transport system permease protein